MPMGMHTDAFLKMTSLMSRAGISQLGLSEPNPMIFTLHRTDSVAINSPEKFSVRKWPDFHISVVKLSPIELLLYTRGCKAGRSGDT